MYHPQMTKNVESTSFCVTKHGNTLKGNYKRLLAFGNLGITTYQTDTLKVTNQWPYTEICGIEPESKNQRQGKFILYVREPGSKKKKEFKFSYDFRPLILTEAFNYSHLFQEKPSVKLRINATKLRWNEKTVEVILEVHSHCVLQLDPRSNKLLAIYYYKDIDFVSKFSENSYGFVIATGKFYRLHIFYTKSREEFITTMGKECYNKIGVALRESNESRTQDYFIENRMGNFSADEHITSHAEFQVQKLSVFCRNDSQPVNRILCLTETCLVERDPETYILVTLRPLCDIFALIREYSQPQQFTIEYVNGDSRIYLSTDRDSLLASLLDGVRSSGNRDVCVKIKKTERWLRFGPLFRPLDDEVESMHMKMLQQTPGNMHFNEAVARFNANIPYSGLLHAVTQEGFFSENKERLIKGTLNALINREGNQSEISSGDLEAQFHALRRLVASKAGFQSFTNLNKMRETLGRKVVTALRRNDESVAHAAIDMINALIQPMHENFDIRQEQLNKSSIMSSSKFLENMLDIFSLHVLRGTGALVISVMLDFLMFTICPPYCETSDGEYFDNLLKLVAERGRVMFKLFHHPSMAIVKGAGLIMHALIDEADPEVGDSMQSLALVEGALPQHLLNSCFARNNDHRSFAFRQLNRQLLSLWVTGNTEAKELLQRVLPIGLTLFLNSTDEPPTNSVDYLFVRDNLEMAQVHMQETRKKNNETIRVIEKKIDHLLMHWRSKIGIDIKPMRDNKDEKPVCLRKRRRRIKVLDNWKMFFYQFYKDHAKPNLIWNMKTREEFRMALEKEITDFKRERDFCSHIELAEKTDDPDDVEENVPTNKGEDDMTVATTVPVGEKKQLVHQLLLQAAKVSWNYIEFKVVYASLQNEIRVGDYYLRLLLEEDERVSRQHQQKQDKIAISKEATTPSQSEDTVSESDKPRTNDELSPILGMKQVPQINVENGEHVDNAENGDNVSIESANEGVAAVGGVIKIRQSYEFFHNLYRRFLQYHKTDMRCMCLYAMAIVYGRCFKEIGPIADCDLFVGLLERTNNKTERDRLLLLLEKLILEKRNIDGMLDAGLVKVLISMVTIAHLHVNRALTPLHNQMMIESASSDTSSNEDQYKEWFYQLPGTNQKSGPISFKELKELPELTPEMRVWSQGLDQWLPAREVSQLKWSHKSMSCGQAVLTDSEVSAKCLSVLLGMCRSYPSYDKLGGIVRPMPRAKRQLTQHGNLIHIVQLLLTFDPILVERVALLLNSVFVENPFKSRLYITGVFYFILMYMGCNVLTISQFLKENHIGQGFRNDETLLNTQSPIVAKSVLGNILPEAMICYLEHHTSEEFAQIFLGEYDTPETIWNSEMRRFMIEKIACHLMEFSPRLPVNNRALYQYLSIPVISYPQLENELFCGSYYLRHLCDTTRFPDWPIRNPVSLLREILQTWKNEVEKKPPPMSVKDAYAILNLQLNPDLTNDPQTRTKEESLIRKAYYKLSMMYHPDKNPEGRDMFEKVNTAYHFLCNRVKLCAGAEPKNILLLLKSQSILFQRCQSHIEKHKYSGYPMLIATITKETESDQLFQNTDSSLLPAAAELCYYTVSVSALNAEEMRRQEGIQALQAAFSRCVGVVTITGSTSSDVAVRVCGFVVVFLSVAAQFPACRERIHEIPQISRDLVRLLYFKNLPQLCALVARCVADLSCDVWLQNSMFENGAMFHLVNYLFEYDYTLDEGGVARSEDNHKQEILNRLAVLSLLAIARLCGSPNDKTQTIQDPSPRAAQALKCTASLLTPYVARKITEFDGDLASLRVILKLLNSNSETPYLLWDNRTRSELRKYVESQQESLVKSGECDAHFGAEFKYSLFEKELVIGEVFVRVYNEQKDFQLENSRSFCIDLLLFLKSEEELMRSRLTEAQLLAPTLNNNTKGVNLQDVMRHSMFMQSAVEALVNVLECNPNIAIQLIGYFKMLFNLMSWRLFPGIQVMTVKVIRAISVSEECLEDIAASNVLVHLVRLLEFLPQNTSVVLDTISRMISITGLLRELVYRGCIIYTLHILTNTANRHQQTRSQAAHILGRMMMDKLVGNRIKAILLQFLPLIFLDAIKDCSGGGNGDSTSTNDAFIHMFDGWHEHPELIWNDETKQCLAEAVAQKKDAFLEDQSRDLNKKWSVTEDYRVPYDSVVNCGLCIAGVYLHLFIANPNWVLRNPDEFCNQLFTKWLQTIDCNQQASEVLELTTDALARFLDSHSGILDALPRKGYVHKVFEALNTYTTEEAVLKAGLIITHQMANSKLCVTTMASIEAIKPIVNAVKLRPDQTGLAGETLFRLFQNGSDDLVAQAVRVRLVSFLLDILEKGVVGVKDPGQVKAYLVKALKVMQRSPTYGPQITAQLDDSRVWSQFRDQSHDLYLTNQSQISGYLTGRSVESSGYLTYGGNSAAGGAASASTATSPIEPPPTNVGPKPPPKPKLSTATSNTNKPDLYF